jgi:hypothetical protein
MVTVCPIVSQMNPDEPLYPLSLRFILTLSSHLRLGLPSNFFPLALRVQHCKHSHHFSLAAFFWSTFRTVIVTLSLDITQSATKHSNFQIKVFLFSYYSYLFHISEQSVSQKLPQKHSRSPTPWLLNLTTLSNGRQTTAVICDSYVIWDRLI